MNNLQWRGFKVSNDDQLIPIRQLELFKEKSQLEAKGNLSQSERARLGEVEAQLAALDAKTK